jgi:hypothetical protein
VKATGAWSSWRRQDAPAPQTKSLLWPRCMDPDGSFITGSDFLIDGGVTASFFFGALAQP